MLLSARAGRRAVAGALGAGTIAGAMLFGAIPSALADDPALNPPNCSAADLAGVAAGVSASTSAYLFTHPDVNWFFTSLEGLPRDQVRSEVADYLSKNPFVKNDLTGIRQPLVDLKDRCGSAPAPALP
jgi:hemophore-related protein